MGDKLHLSKEKVCPRCTCGEIMSTMGAHFYQTGVPSLFWVFFDDGNGSHQGFCLYRMAEIKWRERDCKSVRDASLHDGNVRDTLAHCGLIKFMRISLMRSLGLLMQTLIGFWDVDEEVFLF